MKDLEQGGLEPQLDTYLYLYTQWLEYNLTLSVLLPIPREFVHTNRITAPKMPELEN